MKFTFYWLALLAALPTFAQNNLTISGRVTEKSTNLPLEAATVYLETVSDSAVFDYTITGKDGTFSFKTQKKSKPLNIKVSFVGFKTFALRKESLTESLVLGDITLEEDANLLGEVIVTSEAPPVRVKKDTLEFNASSFKLRPDANVETLLKQLPGVEIDTDGKITVNGKEVNQILVNGKPFFDKDGKVALQNLPSDIINKVQVTDTKTKEEELSGKKASSNEASINLTIDEKKNKGYFGKMMAGYGTDDRYESSLLANYFKDKTKISVIASANNINSVGFSMNELFDSMGGGRNNGVWVNDNGSFGINGMRFGGGSGITTSSIVGVNYADQWAKDLDVGSNYFRNEALTENQNRQRTTTFLEDESFTTASETDSEDHVVSHNASMRFEYKIDSTLSVYFEPKFNNNTSKRSRRFDEASTDDQNGRLQNQNAGTSFDHTTNDRFDNAITVFKSFRKKGRSLSFNANTSASVQQSDADNESLSLFYEDQDNDGVTDLVTEDLRNQKRGVRTTNDTYSFSGEFSEPLQDSLRLEMGVRYSRRTNANDRRTFNIDPVTGSLAVDATQSAYLGSSLSTVTPYAGFGLQKSKYDFSISAGTEISDLSNESFYLSQRVKLDRNYMFAFLNANLSYRLTKSKTLWMNYDYNVDFPTASQILPVEDLSNPLNTFIGNPFIEPDKYHSVYMNFYDYDFASKTGFSIYAGGNYYRSQIVSSTTFDQSRKRTTTYVNVSDPFTAWLGGSWNKSLKREAHSFKYGFGLNTSLSRSKGFTNGVGFEAESRRITPRVNFTYDYGELISVNPTYSATFAETAYKNYLISGASTVLHKVSLQFTSYWPKHFVFGNDLSYNYNSNIADGFKKDFYLLNMSLGYNFLKDRLLAKVKVYDVLNQNLNATRTITATSIRDEENTVLQRYAMFSLTFKLDKFGAKKPDSGMRMH